MPQDSLIFNTNIRKFTLSNRKIQSLPSPRWGHGDVRDFGATFTKLSASGQVEVLTNIVSAQVNVSALTAPGTVLATYTAGSPVNYEYPFLLTLRSGLDTLMNGATEPKQVLGQFRLLTADGGDNSYDFDLWITPKQGTTATPDTASEDGFLTQSQISSLYVPKDIPANMLWTITDRISGIRYSIVAQNGKLDLIQD